MTRALCSHLSSVLAEVHRLEHLSSFRTFLLQTRLKFHKLKAVPLLFPDFLPLAPSAVKLSCTGKEAQCRTVTSPGHLLCLSLVCTPLSAGLSARVGSGAAYLQTRRAGQRDRSRWWGRPKWLLRDTRCFCEILWSDW